MISCVLLSLRTYSFVHQHRVAVPPTRCSSQQMSWKSSYRRHVTADIFFCHFAVINWVRINVVPNQDERFDGFPNFVQKSWVQSSTHQCLILVGILTCAFVLAFVPNGGFPVELKVREHILIFLRSIHYYAKILSKNSVPLSMTTLLQILIIFMQKTVPDDARCSFKGMSKSVGSN